MKISLIILAVSFSLSAVSANINTSKSQKYRALYGKCKEKYLGNEEAIFECMRQEKLAAIRAAKEKNAHLE